jgi:signal transduction histidine kinase
MGRLLIQVLLSISIFTATYAQKTSTAVAPANKAALIKTVDSLNIAADYLYVGNPDSARKMAEKALLISEDLKYNYGIGHAFLNVGHVYWSQSYYPISLYYFNSALSYIPKNKPALLAECFNSIGRVYIDLKDYSSAKRSLDTCAYYCGNDTDALAELHSQRSYLYTRLMDYDRAIAESWLCITLSKKINDNKGIAIVYSRLSTIYRLKNQYNRAIAYADTALQMSYGTGNRRLRAKTFIELALNYNELKNFDKAIDLAKKGVALSDSIGVMDGISSGYKALMFSFEQKGDLNQALVFQKKYNAAIDSINVSDKRKNTELIQNYFTLNSRLNNIAAMEIKGKEAVIRIEYQNDIIIVLSISLLIVMMALFITYYYFKQKKLLISRMQRQHEALIMQKQLIEEQSVNLTAVNKLKDKLLAVIGHDLRTPFANLHNIIELFETDSLSTEEIYGLMKRMDPVIKGAELTLSNLLEWAGSQIRGINVEPSVVDISKVGAEMEQTFNYLLQQKDIRFQNAALTGYCVRADEKHIKVIVSNLISNAIKFTEEKGIITLTSKVKGHELIVCLTDTGKGIADEQLNKLFNLNAHFSEIGTLGEMGTGIGLFLCKELVEFNGGQLWVTSEVNSGSSFSFSLPLI